LKIPIEISGNDISRVELLQNLKLLPATEIKEVAAPAIPRNNGQLREMLQWQPLLIYVFYGLVALVLVARILNSLGKIRRLSINYPSERLGEIRFVNTDEPGTPFSFFRWLFWNSRIELNSEPGQKIFRHELFHINQRHSVDILFLEIVAALAWFNPFFILIRKEMKAIHEFLADEHAINKSNDWEYAELLLRQVLNTRVQLVNPFFHNQIKRRITMIINPKKTSHQYLRKLMVLPVTFVVFLLFAFTFRHEKATGIEKCLETATIVVDAGHGGNDPGAISTDGKYTEAQLSLELARELQALAPAYNVRVVMTRDNDQFPGNASNKIDALRKRLEICDKTRPDLFISLHLNAADGSSAATGGFDAFIAGKKKSDESRAFATSILRQLSQVYQTNVQPRQREDAGVFVLDKNEFPAVILECGYITNAGDLAFIKNPANRQAIARNILEAIVGFRNNPNTPKESPREDTVPRSSTLPRLEGGDNIYEKVDIEASFPGGVNAWTEFLQKNLDAQVPINNHAPAGKYTVFAIFKVGRDGKVTDVRPLTKHGFGMETEVVNLIRRGPGWLPARQNGRVVSAYRKQPVTFVVPKEQKSESNNSSN
jgi:N-acetylmuramoyl-L-alanine amidase